MANFTMIAALMVLGLVCCQAAPTDADEQDTPAKHVLPPHLLELLRANADGKNTTVTVTTASKNGTISQPHSAPSSSVGVGSASAIQQSAANDDSEDSRESKQVPSSSSSGIARRTTTTTTSTEAPSNSTKRSSRPVVPLGSFAI